jgi:hypothetical protein
MNEFKQSSEPKGLRFFERIRWGKKGFLLAGSVAVWSCLQACQIQEKTPLAEDSELNAVSSTWLFLELENEGLAKASSGAATGKSWPLDSVFIRAEHPESGERLWAQGWGEQGFALEGLTAGAGVKISAEIHGLGQVLYRGETTVDLWGDKKNRVEISCQPQASRLTVSAQWPVDFSAQASGGVLEVRTTDAENQMGNGSEFTPDYTTELIRQGDFLVFHLPAFPGDRHYEVRVRIWDEAGVVLAEANAPSLWIPMGTSLHLDMPLRLSAPGADLGLVLPQPTEHLLSLTFPAGKRRLAQSGAAVMVGVFPAPTTEQGGSEAEWLALWNRSVDSLDFSGCRILRDGGGSSTKTTPVLAFTMAPGQVFFLGKSAAPGISAPLEGLALTNTGGELVLVCEDPTNTPATVEIDRLRYVDQEGESILAPAGRAAWLNPVQVSVRDNPESWCRGEPLSRPALGIQLRDVCGL